MKEKSIGDINIQLDETKKMLNESYKKLEGEENTAELKELKAKIKRLQALNENNQLIWKDLAEEASKRK
ncbi:MAG TPA: hypothetical protein PLB45_03465 [Bacilli bacterium]|jgi:hypothetical protein|nr:hypothetical protein [Bacilli bacterium]HPZ23336.1 hypothetical protein [Bacilli bacterium]HQC83910.1 hypothetical protein [Bacilli bacterium]